MTAIDNKIAKGQLTTFVFEQTDVAASQTNATLTIGEVRDTAAGADDQNACDGYVMPWDFEIIGISARASAARSAGTLTLVPTIDGTAVSGLSAVLDGTNTQQHRATAKRETHRGVAGGRIGCQITTDGAWAPVTADIGVVVWVLQYLAGV